MYERGVLRHIRESSPIFNRETLLLCSSALCLTDFDQWKQHSLQNLQLRNIRYMQY